MALNFSHFVARKIWQNRSLSPRRFRAHRIQRGAFYQGFLVYMHSNIDLLQTARNWATSFCATASLQEWHRARLRWLPRDL